VISEEQAPAVFTCGPWEDEAPGRCIVNSTPVTIPNQAIYILDQMENYKDLSVTSLIFNEPNVVTFVPSNAFQYFPNVEHAKFNHVGMTNLVKDAFINCKKLTNIVVINNEINHLPDGFARKCSGVRNITMTNNGLRTINDNALEGLSRLMVVNFSHNNISCIPPKLFSFTPDIFEIVLKSNQIGTIGRRTFQGLNYLIKIDLSSNAIAFIPTMDFTETAVNSGLDFDLSNNPIDAIQPDFLEEFFELRSDEENPRSSVTLLMLNEGENCIGSTGTVVKTMNFEAFNSTLKNCYANWTDELNQKKEDCEV
jgi:hypothetical protein